MTEEELIKKIDELKVYIAQLEKIRDSFHDKIKTLKVDNDRLTDINKSITNELIDLKIKLTESEQLK